MSDFNPISQVVLHLMKAVLYQSKHSELWATLLNVQAAVRDYVAVIGLELVIDESEGFAYLKQSELDLDKEEQLPRLVQRRQLSYSVSLLCVLLRKKLIENDLTSNTRIILSKQNIHDMMSIFLPNRSNEIKNIDQVETAINKAIELGFLRVMKNDSNLYEVQRIIKAFVDADWLQNIDLKLQEYLEYVGLSTD